MGQSRALCVEAGLARLNLTLAESFDRNHQHHPALVTAPGLSARGPQSRQQSDLHRSEAWLCCDWPGLSRWLLRRRTLTSHTDTKLSNPRIHILTCEAHLCGKAVFTKLFREKSIPRRRDRDGEQLTFYFLIKLEWKKHEPSLVDLRFPNEFSLKVKARNTTPPATLKKGQETEQSSAVSSGCGEGLSPLHVTWP